MCALRLMHMCKIELLQNDPRVNIIKTKKKKNTMYITMHGVIFVSPLNPEVISKRFSELRTDRGAENSEGNRRTRVE